ncbi:MAG: ABC transporter ATP-binding protein [Gemmatimonadetes bacterium]|nr:ABC transporter ATP-binding protein [Gemmatimonadota bacterium]
MIFEARELVVRYRRNASAALDGVSLRVPSGCLYAILGPNGSGKSTLMRALLGTLPLESGSAALDGRTVNAWTRAEIARAVGVVPQIESVAFPISVREMVGMGRYPHLRPLGREGVSDRLKVQEALRECDVESLVDRDVSTLSGGEAQRVRIARALAQAPRALILDEPTASLDVRHEMEILRLLRRWADSGITVVLITHRLNAASRFADRLLLLSRGRVAAEGTPNEVLREDILESVYEWELDVRTDPVTGSLAVTAR